MSAREEILARVRAGLKSSPDERQAQATAWLAARRAGPQPALADDLVARFMAKAESLASTVHRVTDAAAVPGAVADYLRQQQLPLHAVATPACQGYDWAAAGLALDFRPARDADRVGITDCFCALAETGTLMLLSAPETPASVSLLPETHIALVPVTRIVGTMENAFDRLGQSTDQLPRAVNFISGPSRTGDIEQTIVLGAHGPCRVHLILIG